MSEQVGPTRPSKHVIAVAVGLILVLLSLAFVLIGGVVPDILAGVLGTVGIATAVFAGGQWRRSYQGPTPSS